MDEEQVKIVEVDWHPRRPRRITLALDGEFYDALLQCLRAHADNHIFGETGVRLTDARVLNCGTARKVLEKLQSVVRVEP